MALNGKNEGIGQQKYFKINIFQILIDELFKNFHICNINI
jgi:hypothetical protein